MNKILFAGMPNSGKSTAFNLISGGNAEIGNWHGVTVDITQKVSKIHGKTYTFCDLPGIYSLNAQTLEEKATLNALKDKNALIVFLAECAVLPAALRLLKEIYALNRNVILAVNMYREFSKNGGVLKKTELAERLKIPIITGDFNTKKGIKPLSEAIYRYNSAQTAPDFDLSGLFSEKELSETFLDKIILGKYTSAPFAVAVFALTFYISFGKYGAGSALSALLIKSLNYISFFIDKFFISKLNSLFLKDFIANGILNGLGGLLTFIPQILFMSLSVRILELSGYMARVAFLTERFLKNTGLNGRAVFSVFTGLGCTAVGAIATNGLENDSVKKNALFALSGVPCGAKLPVFLLLSRSAGCSPLVFMLIVYFSGAFYSFLRLFIAKKAFKTGKRVPLLTEIPPLRIPDFHTLAKSLLKTLKQFIIKIGTVIFIINCSLFLLKSVDFGFNYVCGNYDESILACISRIFSFAFKPVGLDDWRICVTLFTGLFAKEGAVGAISALFPQGLNLTTASLAALSAFFYIYTPCLTALASIAHEGGKIFALKIAFLTLFEGFTLSYVTYFCFEYPLVAMVIALTAAFWSGYEKFYGRKKRQTVAISIRKI